MNKEEHFEACGAAMKATEKANTDNTSSAHSEAASFHKIAAEKSKLMGKDDLFQKHSQMASAHDAAAARLEAASPEKNAVKAPDDYAKAISACSESTMPCPYCKKDVDTSEQDGVETGTVECPHCKEKFHPMAHVEAKDSHLNKDGTFKGGFDGCVLHMQSADGGGHSEESAKKICGAIAQKVGAGNALKKTDAIEAAFHFRVNELVDARLAKKAPLMAGIARTGLSLNDLNTYVREAIVGLPQFASPSPGMVGPAWVADIVAPEHEGGETWTAIVQGNDQKLYAVEFTIEDESVTIAGEPKEVERVTDYDYVGEIETEARKAFDPSTKQFKSRKLEAGDMSDKATKKSAAATALTAEAAEATKNAGDTKDGHTAASAAHKAAYDAHKEAYTAHAKAGSPDSVLEAHMDAMTSHKQHMADHAAACEACQAKTAAELLTTQVHACHAELQASGLNPSLDDLKHAVFNQFAVLLKQAELAKHLSTKLEAGGPGSGRHKGFGSSGGSSDSYKSRASEANQASQKANKSGNPEDHYAAHIAHSVAANHEDATEEQRNEHLSKAIEHAKKWTWHSDTFLKA